MRFAQQKKRARGKTEAQKEKNNKLIKQAHQEYLHISQQYLNKIHSTLEEIKKRDLDITDAMSIENINGFIIHANRQIEQIERRVLQGQVILHSEKVFSIFEPHTEWVVKGKAGVPVELGLRVCVLEDQYQFILHHRVMEKETDDQIAIDIVQETQKRFSSLRVVSFDKGFHSPKNQEVLSAQLELLALPRKGRLSAQAQLFESSEVFRKARRKHSAVESAIHALEVHGLEQCPDHGIDGFKRYVALAIVSRNIQRIGAILQKREQRKTEKQKKRRTTTMVGFLDALAA
jgi:hypothetical protein